jgi:hypothetical protein
LLFNGESAGVKFITALKKLRKGVAEIKKEIESPRKKAFGLMKKANDADAGKNGENLVGRSHFEKIRGRGAVKRDERTCGEH